MDELERGSRFQQGNEEHSPESHDLPDRGESSPNGGGEQSPEDTSTKHENGDTRPSPETGSEEVDAGAQVMGNLPRTRPQRRSDRRPAGAGKRAGATKPKPAARRGAASSRDRPSASSAARTRPTAKQTNKRRTAETATRAAARKRGPGIPQLAVGVALGAAKLPLKVTATVARQATELIGRGLRRR